MTPSLTFWAQALDNTSPDHIAIGKDLLDSEQTVQRENAVSSVSDVAKTDETVFDEKGIRIVCNASHFVVEVISVERDVAGRAAPIVCLGCYETEEADELAATVAVGYSDFAKKIGRTLYIEAADFIPAFAALKKNASRRKLMLRSGIGFVLLLLLFLARCLGLRRSGIK